MIDTIVSDFGFSSPVKNGGEMCCGSAQKSAKSEVFVPSFVLGDTLGEAL